MVWEKQMSLRGIAAPAYYDDGGSVVMLLLSTARMCAS